MCVIIFSEQPPLFTRPKIQPQVGLNGSPGGGYPPQQQGPGYPVPAVQAQHPTQTQEQRPAANNKLIAFLNKSIEKKEAALRCPVCLETAKAPIFTCQQQHLVCFKCRPRLTSCPECREDYQEPPRIHRYAERDAEELEKLQEELAKLTN